MTDMYILEGHKPVPCEDILTWGKWMESASRIVARDIVNDTKVSTVFLGLNFSFGQGIPILFETRIFGGKEDGYHERYSTWDKALKGHQEALKLIET